MALLPGALRASERHAGPGSDARARCSDPALQSLRPADPRAARDERGGDPLLRGDRAGDPDSASAVRPGGTAVDRGPAAGRRGIAKAAPDLTGALLELNRFLNMGAYNPGGAEGLDGLSIPEQRARQEGFLYWLAWTAHNGVSLFSTADGQGPWRRVALCGVPSAVVDSLLQAVLAEVGATDPEFVQQLIGGPLSGGVQPTSPVQDLLDTQFGGCSFDALPTDPRTPPLPGGLPDCCGRWGGRDQGAPTLGKVAAMVLFTLSVFGLLMFLWVSFGGNAAAAARGLSLKAAFPEATMLVAEADVRMAGVNIGKVKSTELAPDGRRTVARDRGRRALRPGQGEHPRDPAPEEPARRDVRRALAGRGRAGPTCRTAAAAQRAGRATRWSSTRSSACSTAVRGGTSRPGCASRGSPSPATTAATSTARSATPHPSSRRRRPTAAAGRAGARAAPARPQHGPCLRRDHRAQRPAPRPDRERRADLRRARVARPGAGGHVPDPAHLPARDARHGGAAGALRRQHRPAGARPAPAGRRPRADAARPGRPLARSHPPVRRHRSAGGGLVHRRPGGRPLHHGGGAGAGGSCTCSSAS